MVSIEENGGFYYVVMYFFGLNCVYDDFEVLEIEFCDVCKLLVLGCDYGWWCVVFGGVVVMGGEWWWFVVVVGVGLLDFFWVGGGFLCDGFVVYFYDLEIFCLWEEWCVGVKDSDGVGLGSENFWV